MVDTMRKWTLPDEVVYYYQEQGVWFQALGILIDIQ